MRRWVAVSAVVAVMVYVVMWIGWVQDWVWLSAVDQWSLDVCLGFAERNPVWEPVWDVLCTVLGPTTFRIVSLVLIIALLLLRYLRAALFLVISVELSGLVTGVAKHLADRPRPVTQMVYAYGMSFPSGHALSVTVAVLALLTVVLPVVAVRWRTALMVLGVVIVVVVGFGRVALNVHHPSDVLAGYALGYLYYLLCMVTVRPLPLTQIMPKGERPVVPDTAP